MSRITATLGTDEFATGIDVTLDVTVYKEDGTAATLTAATATVYNSAGVSLSTPAVTITGNAMSVTIVTALIPKALNYYVTFLVTVDGKPKSITKMFHILFFPLSNPVTDAVVAKNIAMLSTQWPKTQSSWWPQVHRAFDLVRAEYRQIDPDGYRDGLIDAGQFEIVIENKVLEIVCRLAAQGQGTESIYWDMMTYYEGKYKEALNKTHVVIDSDGDGIIDKEKNAFVMAIR